MALLDDLLSTLNFVTPARSSSAPASNFRGEAGSGLSGLANAGNRAMGEQEQALAILSRMSGQQKRDLFGGPSGEYMSLEEEAADPRTGTANRIVYTMSKMMPAEDSIRVEELPNPVPRSPVYVQLTRPCAEPLCLLTEHGGMRCRAVSSGWQRRLDQNTVDANNMSSIKNGAVPLRDCLWNNKANPCRVVTNSALMATLGLLSLVGSGSIGMKRLKIGNAASLLIPGEMVLRRELLRQAAGPRACRLDAGCRVNRAFSELSNPKSSAVWISGCVAVSGTKTNGCRL
jgi:hypothetical protein